MKRACWWGHDYEWKEPTVLRNGHEPYTYIVVWQVGICVNCGLAVTRKA